MRAEAPSAIPAVTAFPAPTGRRPGNTSWRRSSAPKTTPARRSDLGVLRSRRAPPAPPIQRADCRVLCPTEPPPRPHRVLSPCVLRATGTVTAPRLHDNIPCGGEILPLGARRWGAPALGARPAPQSRTPGAGTAAGTAGGPGGILASRAPLARYAEI